MDDKKIFDMHRGGKISVSSKKPITSMEDLSIIYTPGVAKVSKAIAEDVSKAKEFTIAGNTVAVVSDGSAVLGLGNIGPEAALPVMEGKAAIFKEFGGLNAFPICIRTQDVEEIIALVKNIAPNFAAINLEDISAPRCFEIEERLTKELDIPVMHDDQHGTAVVLLAALLGALQLYPKSKLRIVVTGAGAAGVAVTKLLFKARGMGLLDIDSLALLDSKGVVAMDRDDLNDVKRSMAILTKQEKTMDLHQAIEGADVFIGVSAPNILTKDDVRMMNKDPFVFAMANPDPEIMPDDAKAGGAVIVGTGRSDYPNQVNNALAYPGIFKGLIEGGFKRATDEVKITAAKAIFEYNKPKLDPEHILPSVLDKNVPNIIANAIKNI